MLTKPYIALITESRDTNYEQCRTNLVPSHLPPVDGLRVIVEQFMFAMFIDYGTGSPADGFNTYYNKLYAYLGELPSQIHTGNSSLDNIYYRARKVLEDAVAWCYNPTTTELNTDEMYHAFHDILFSSSMDYTKQDFHCYYTGTMSEIFFDQWCNLFFGTTFPDKYGEVDALLPLYTPNLRTQKADDYLHVTKNATDRVIVTLDGISKLPYKFVTSNEDFKGRAALYYLSHFDLTSLDISNVIGLIASFCITHNQYVMTFDKEVAKQASLLDICFDLVTGSSYVENAGLDRSVGASDFVAWVADSVRAGRLQPITDYDLFGKLLTYSKADANIVNYFTKPVNAISATEALAFRESVYSSIFADRVIAGLEADTEDVSTDTGDDTAAAGDATPDTDVDVPDAPDMGNDTTDDPDGETSDDSADEKEDAPIDPNKMLLELNIKDTTLKDFLYRDIVARRIDNILTNPPENARPNDLLMLKRWRSHWLYLTSIACLKDFLMRISIRLSDV